MVHQFAGYDKSLYGSGRQLEFQIAEYPFTHSHHPASACLFLDRQFGDASQSVVAEQHFNSIGRAGLRVLPDDAAFRGFEDQKKVIDVMLLANQAHRQAPDELPLEPERAKVARLSSA